jgi:ectoine hydroxylase-related dioxygenase (phytanoyl-CoA dioxygenase family)
MAVDKILTDDYELSDAQKESYQTTGHILLRAVATNEEIKVVREEIGEVVNEFARQKMLMNQRTTYGKAFIQVSNIWVKNDTVKQFVLARKFAKIAAELMGVAGVRIYHDQALYKEPGGGFTPWHQDQVYWPLETSNTITMWMPLVDIPAEVGSMTFASGTHKLGYINKDVISDESHRNIAEFIESKQIPTVSYGAMNAGDATFHAGWTMHSAPGNPTQVMREVMTVIYVADGSIIVEPDSNARRNDLKNWFPGLNPGDLVSSHLNPLVYSQT